MTRSSSAWHINCYSLLTNQVSCDEILVLKHGVVAERGPHGELLRDGGLYASMWAQQSQAGQPSQASPQAGGGSGGGGGSEGGGSEGGGEDGGEGGGEGGGGSWSGGGEAGMHLQQN